MFITFWTSHDWHDAHDLKQHQQTLRGVIERVVLVQLVHVCLDVFRAHVQMRLVVGICNTQTHTRG